MEAIWVAAEVRAGGAYAHSVLAIDAMARHQATAGTSIEASLMVADVRGAAAAFQDVYLSTGGDDGFVSIEVRPQLARDTEGSIAEALRLWAACNSRRKAPRNFSAPTTGCLRPLQEKRYP